MLGACAWQFRVRPDPHDVMLEDQVPSRVRGRARRDTVVISPYAITSRIAVRSELLS
jgi:hypothetical protein